MDHAAVVGSAVGFLAVVTGSEAAWMTAVARGICPPLFSSLCPFCPLCCPLVDKSFVYY